MRQNLEAAVTRLEGLIGGNTSDVTALETALEEVTAAYAAADALLEADITTLQEQDTALSEGITALQSSLETADDAIRGGILKESDIPRKYTDILGTSTKIRLDTMVHNVIINSMEKPKIQMSPEVYEATMGLRGFLFENVYKNPKAKGEEKKAINMITNLYQFYMEHLDLLPAQFLGMLEEKGTKEEQIVCDYIAGMTDTYAVKKFEEYFVPESWKF